jgi:hypothetical protein
MHPQTEYGHLIATVEIFTGMCFLAVLTGLVFARFSRPRARFVFATHAVVTHHEGRPTLMIRTANARHNTISRATARLWLIRAERTKEGDQLRRFYDLKLERSEHPMFVLSWMLFHYIDKDSPLHCVTETELPCPFDRSNLVRIVRHVHPKTRLIDHRGRRRHLRRAFGFGDTGEFDPFLLLDDFRNDRPDEYRAGFPWHPHRGIETITYVLAGNVEHGDSLGNRGNLGAGDVQWMTAGRGIMHQEMPQGDAQRPHARLPALGQPAVVAEDDGAALSGHQGRRDSRNRR